jgi:hypothetical protein
MAKIKVKFKSDQKPEAVSRLIDKYIQNMDDPSHSIAIPPSPTPAPIVQNNPTDDWITAKGASDEPNNK